MDHLTGSATISHTIELPMTICSGNYKFRLGYWNNQTFTYTYASGPIFTVINITDNLQIDQPNGWMVALAGQNLEIRWNSSIAEDVSLFYSLDNGQNWNDIIEQVPTGCGHSGWNYNNYNWLIPTTIEGTFDESRIRVERANNPSTSFVSPVFRITNVIPIEITTPLQGDIYQAGEQVLLSFTSAEHSNVDVYFINSFGSYSYLETYEATLGSHSLSYNANNFDEGYNKRFVIFHHTSGLNFESPYFAIFSNVPACMEPVNVQITDVTCNSAEIDWHIYGNATTWNLEWGMGAFEPGEGTLVAGIVENPYTLNDLPQGSWITFYLQSNCGEGIESEWVGPFSFLTNCGIVDVPFFENFDDIAPYQVPVCWSVSGDIMPQVIDFISYSSSQSAYFYAQPNGSSVLITPEIDANLSNVRIKFKALPDNSMFQKTIEVGTVPVSGQGNNFTLVDQIVLSDLPGQPWQEFTVIFADYAGNNKHIAIRLVNTHTEWTGFYLDDLLVEYLPACPEPHNLQAHAITLNSALLNWQQTGISSQWDIIYGLYGFDPETQGTQVIGLSFPEFEANGLNHSTFYEFYVRGYCDGLPSAWSTAGLFRTECGDASISIVLPVGDEVFNTNATSD
jgi:hypothetical protein